MDRGARFYEKQNLRRFLDRGKARDRLLDPIVVHTEIFAPQPFHEVAAVVGDDHSDVHSVNLDLNRLIRLLLIFLSLGEKTHAEHHRAYHSPSPNPKKIHPPAIQPTNPHGSPYNPSP